MIASLSRATSRRVAVTGIGVISPLAADAESTWKRMINGESGIIVTPEPVYSKCDAKIGGFVPTEGSYGFDPLKYVEPKDLRRMARFIIYGMAAAEQAIRDSGFLNNEDVDHDRIGVSVGSGIGGIEFIEASVIKLQNNAKLSPLFIPAVLINLASGNIAIKYKLRGPSAAHCAACASGLQSIGEAARNIALGDADIMVAGGCESSMCEVSYAGFNACRALVTTYNDTPTTASRPWDTTRKGFVMSEGAGVIILEEYQRAKNRGAKIYGEILGYGSCSDSYNITAPDPTGIGAYTAMRHALQSSGLSIDDVDYIKAHATSTPAGDEVELLAARDLFGGRTKPLYMSSMKSSFGHLLGASGAVETALLLLAMRDGIAPPTLNLNDPVNSFGIDLIPNVARKMPINVAMSNAFGFGGINVSVIVRTV